MSDASDVRVTRDGATATITLNRPEARNALTLSVVSTLRAALDAAAADSAVRVIVLTGAGGHFCAGADLRRTLSEVPNLMERLEEYMDDFHGVVRAIVRAPKPVVAMLDGAAVGFGADLALAADLRVASHDAYVQEKFVHIGLMPDGGGTFWLPHLVGKSRAMQLVLLADKLESAELERLGLLVARVPASDLSSATMTLARKLEAGPPLAFARAKAAILASLGDIDAALAREREGQLRLLRSQDCMEGVMAWMEKRVPKFVGA
ncbi:MAG: enoyl-CoA hydratase-related protein [Polyangiaceae bacterium]